MRGFSVFQRVSGASLAARSLPKRGGRDLLHHPCLLESSCFELAFGDEIIPAKPAFRSDLSSPYRNARSLPKRPGGGWLELVVEEDGAATASLREELASGEKL